MTKNKPTNITDTLARFDAMIEWFQSEEFSIEQAPAKLAEVDALATKIETQLTGLKNDITVLKQKFDQP